MRTIFATRALVGAALLAAGVLSTPTTALAQSTAGGWVTANPAQIEQVRRALGQPTILKLDDRQLRFYLEVVARQPRRFSSAEFFSGFDLMNGPTSGGNPMSHKEFLDLINPRELHSTAGITPAEMLQFAMTNWLSQNLLKKALDDVRNARTEKEVQEIRERIDRELAALSGRGN